MGVAPVGLTSLSDDVHATPPLFHLKVARCFEDSNQDGCV